MSSLPFTPSWRRMFALTFSFVLLGGFVLLAMGRNTAVALQVNTLAPQEEACLPDDPYELQKLSDLLDEANPSSVPVEINRYITVEYIGDATFVDEQPSDPEEFSFIDRTDNPSEEPQEPDSDDIRVGTLEMITVDNKTGHMYKVRVAEEALRAIHDCREQAGMTAGSETLANPPHAEAGFPIFLPSIIGGSGTATAPTLEISPRGRPQGVESRTRLNPNGRYPWNTIASLGPLVDGGGNMARSGCTGTMIGPRLMVTAAHCISSFGQKQFNGVRVTPARTGANTPYGSVWVAPQNSTALFPSRYYLLPDWVNGVGQSKESDWALVVLPPNPFPLLNTWMGYAALSGNALGNYAIYNRGYPTCATNNPTHPSPCQVANMYGDKNNCQLGEYHSLDPVTNWNRNIRHSCATSSGQSGSALYLFLGNSPAVIGTHIGTGICDADLDGSDLIDLDELCTKDDPVLVNVFRRHTPTELWLISLYRETYK
jgi:V8-like Glu-specific endopeptidase